MIGSNVFNLAALLGLSAVIAGRVAVHRRGILFNGAAGLLVMGAGIALVLGAIGG